MLSEIHLAEQQLLGFKHAKRGYSLISLIEGMWLEKEEWEKLKKIYELDYLTPEEKAEIDLYFKTQK